MDVPAFAENLKDILFGNDNNIEIIQNNADADIYNFLRNKADTISAESAESADFAENNNTENTEDIDDDVYDVDADNFVFEITLDNLREVISKIAFPDNLRLETTVKYYEDGINAVKTEDMFLWKKDGKYRYELRVNSRLEETYINDTKKERIENAVTKSSTTKNAVNLFSFDNIPHIPNINYYINLLESGDIRHLAINRHNDENIVQIRYWAESLNQWETIRFSLDTGIVLSVKCYAGDNKRLYYDCVTSVSEAYYNSDEQAKTQTSIADSLFVIK